MKTIYLTTLIGFCAGLILWTADTVLNSFVFTEGSFWTLFLFGSHVHSFVLRILLLLSFTFFGLTVGILRQRQRQALQALQTEKQQNRWLIDHAADAIFVSDQEGNFVDVNEKACAMLGYTRDELLQLNIHALMMPSELAEQPLQFDALRAGHTVQTERTLLHKDGTSIIVEVNGRMLPDGRLEAIVRDIFERRQAEQTLQRALRAYRVLSESNQAVVRAANEMGLMQQICHILVQIGGFRLAWIGFVCQDDDSLVYPVAQAGEDDGYLDDLRIDLRDEVHGRGPTATAMREGRTVFVRDIATDLTYQPWRKAATERGFRSSIALPLIKDDVLLGSLNIYTGETNAFDETEVRMLEDLADDLTLGISLLRNDNARRQSVAALHSSELRFRGFFDNGAVPMAIVNTDGHVVAANEANNTFLHYPLEELIGMHFTDLTFPEDILLDTELFQSLQRGEREDYTIEKRYVRKDGEVVWGRLSVAAIRDEAGVLQYTAVLCQDITARKQVQEALLQLTHELEQRVAARTAELAAANERLQQLTEVKDKFVENVSHELRTPITNIKLYNDLATRRPNRAEMYLARMEREIDRLAGLIEDLLTLSRLDQVERLLATTAIFLNDLIQPLVEDRVPLAESNDLQLYFLSAVDLPQVQVEPEMIGKAISILLTNAINYTPAGGTVTVSTLLQETGAAPQVGIRVQDTGPGVAVDEQQQIFERFYRGQTGRNSGVPGTGLGLAIVKEIAWLHSGNVTVESDGTSGAVFTFWLPTA